MQLSFSHPTRLRMGRTTITLQPKRSLTASLRDAFSRRRNSNDDSSGSYLTPLQFQNLMSGASVSGMTSTLSRNGSSTHGSALRREINPQEASRNSFASNLTPAIITRPSISAQLDEIDNAQDMKQHASTHNFDLIDNDDNQVALGLKNLTQRYNIESYNFETFRSSKLRRDSNTSSPDLHQTTPKSSSQHRMGSVQTLISTRDEEKSLGDKDSKHGEVRKVYSLFLHRHHNYLILYMLFAL